MNAQPIKPGDAGHIELLILQPTPFCNIDCDYCYLGDRLNRKKMSAIVLRRALDAVLASGLVGESLSIVWHAGEPLAVPIDFYNSAFAEITGLFPGLKVIHSIQTNGTLINDEWCRLFSDRDVHIGVSIDGPAAIHDLHRKDRNGRGTHARVMRGIETLKRNNIPFHVIAVVTAASLESADEVFRFFLDLGATYVGFNIEELEGAHQLSTLSERSLTDRVRQFFRRIFYLAKEQGRDRIRIREFDHAFAAISSGGYPNAEIAFQSNQQAAPLAIVSIDCDGNVSTFSPELLGANRQSGESFKVCERTGR